MMITVNNTQPAQHVATLTIDELARVAEQLAPLLKAHRDKHPGAALDHETTERVETVFRHHGVTFTNRSHT